MGGLEIVFGTASFNPGANFPDAAAAKAVLDVVAKHGVTKLDTAQLYGKSEEVIGSVNGGDKFVIDTKAAGGWDAGNSLQPDTLYKKAHESLEKLKVKQVDIFYIHAPDDTISPKVWVPVIDKLYKEGVFKRFGLSNFTVDEVKEVYDVAKENGFVLPSVYQGSYSPVTRLQETLLFPFLREHKISFYAYSPMAGGFLAKSRESILAGANAGRFADNGNPTNNMYRSLYLRPSFLDALDSWGAAAEEEGIPKAELAYRWVSYHSPLKPEQGDAIIFGARNLEQAAETIDGLKKGPLKAKVVEDIDAIWEKIKDEAPLDNFNSHFKAA